MPNIELPAGSLYYVLKLTKELSKCKANKMVTTDSNALIWNGYRYPISLETQIVLEEIGKSGILEKLLAQTGFTNILSLL